MGWNSTANVNSISVRFALVSRVFPVHTASIMVARVKRRSWVRMSLFSAVVASISWVTACGGDDDGDDKGSGGSSGKAGAGAKGGSAGSGGKAGAGGTAGGNAGSSASGSGGKSGGAGTGGTAGTAGASAGTSGTGGSAGTTAGTAGESGEGGGGGEGGSFGGEGGEGGEGGSSAGTSGAGSGGLGGAGSGGAGSGGGGAGSGGAGSGGAGAGSGGAGSGGGGAGSGGAGSGGGGMGGTGGGPTTNLFFSEYLENTTGNPDALEIYNAGSSIDLSACRVLIFNAGANTVASTIQLSGTLSTGAIRVICATNADASCTIAPSLSLMGDNPVALECTVSGTNTTQDVIGQIGTDPGTAWGTNPLDTADVSLRRNCAVTIGDRDGTNAFNPSAQWANFTVSFQDIGGRTCP
jgi:hypothetical protein